MKRIYFIASFGDFSKLPLGGGQTASRRLLMTLRKIGYKVTAIHRHPPTSKNKIVRGSQFLFWTIVDPLLIFMRLAFVARRKSLVLYMGYMGSVLIPLECSIAWITKLLGFNNAMYLAGGGTESVYNNCGPIKRFFERKILQGFHHVLTEGYENMAFVKKLSNAQTFYLPNFTEEGFAPISLPQKPNDRWNMFYFGRINPSKNVLMSIEVFNRLCERYSNMYFTIVGGGPDNYCHQVGEKIENSPYRDRIKRIGRSSHEVLKQMMADQHFYLFPSTEPREGHSNALNEAMSFGLVPIVSQNNFLPSIVGEDRLVAKALTAEAFSDIIIDVIENSEYTSLSQKMFDRVQSNFTQTVVEQKLKRIITSISLKKNR